MLIPVLVLSARPLAYITRATFLALSHIAEELIVIFASFDGLGRDPDGMVFSASNHDATGVGILLEVAHLWQEQGLGTRRSILFTAWGAQGAGEYGLQFFVDPPLHPLDQTFTIPIPRVRSICDAAALAWGE
jgi:hypothetical protein